MGKRSAIPTTEQEVAVLSLGALKRAIRSCEWRAKNKTISHQLRKGAHKNLVWLEAQREKLHGISAPPRRPLRARE
jgi:hypothetical protein